MSAVTSIMRVQQILLARLNDELKPFDLTFPRYEALMLLYYSRRGALPLGKMGDRLQVHRTSVTNIIDGLERSGFVRREPHERDRRTTLAAITHARARRPRQPRPRCSTRCSSGRCRWRSRDLDAITGVLERLRADADGFKPRARRAAPRARDVDPALLARRGSTASVRRAARRPSSKAAGRRRGSPVSTAS